MFLNLKLSNISRTEPLVTSEEATVAPGVRVGIDPGKGEIVVLPGNQISLQLTSNSEPPSWSQLLVVLDDARWRTCQRIYLQYEASGDDIQVQAALRFGSSHGFYDQFHCREHSITSTQMEFGADFHVSPRWAKNSEWLDLHLFFSPVQGRFDLHKLALTGFI